MRVSFILDRRRGKLRSEKAHMVSEGRGCPVQNVNILEVHASVSITKNIYSYTPYNCQGDQLDTSLCDMHTCLPYICQNVNNLEISIQIYIYCTKQSKLCTL